MGRILLLCRLAGRDLRRRPAQAALMLLAIMAATTTLTLALALHGVTSRPYQQTRAATAAPDVVAQLISGPHGLRVQRNAGPEPAQVQALVHAPGVTGYSGPYPVIGVILRARGIAAVAEAEGRNQPAVPADPGGDGRAGRGGRTQQRPARPAGAAERRPGARPGAGAGSCSRGDRLQREHE